MKNYKMNIYANGFSIWHAQIIFSEPMGNSSEALKIIDNAIKNGKKQIREAIVERSGLKIKRLAYEIAESVLLPTNQLTQITIREK